MYDNNCDNAPKPQPPPLAQPSTVHVFTGSPHGKVHAQLEDSFAKLGADVRVHQARPRLRARFTRCHLEPGDLVVCDIRHVTHSLYQKLKCHAAIRGADFVAVRGNSGLATWAQHLYEHGVLP